MQLPAYGAEEDGCTCICRWCSGCKSAKQSVGKLRREWGWRPCSVRRNISQGKGEREEEERSAIIRSRKDGDEAAAAGVAPLIGDLVARRETRLIELGSTIVSRSSGPMLRTSDVTTVLDSHDPLSPSSRLLLRFPQQMIIPSRDCMSRRKKVIHEASDECHKRRSAVLTIGSLRDECQAEDRLLGGITVSVIRCAPHTSCLSVTGRGFCVMSLLQQHFEA